MVAQLSMFFSHMEFLFSYVHTSVESLENDPVFYFPPSKERKNKKKHESRVFQSNFFAMPVKSEKFGTIRSLKKAPINQQHDITKRTQRLIIEKFTDEQLAEFRDLFNMFDKDNQGILTLTNLVQVMRSIGQTPTEADMIDLMREIDIDNSGSIDFYEFVRVISHEMSPSERQEEIRYAFDLFDENQDGFLTIEELKSTMEKYFPNSIDDRQIRQMIELADRSGHGQISFDDFLQVALCRSANKSNLLHI